ncbi:MAG: hypothetical protein ABIJ34_04320 [archaeon]
MENSKKYTLFIIIYAILIACIYIFRVGGEKYFEPLTNIVNLVTGLITLVFGYLAIRYFGMKTLQGKSILVLSASVFIWLLADMLWSIIFGDAIVSFADVLYLMGYPLMFLGVYYGILIVKEDFFSDRKRVLLVLGAIVLCGLLYFKFFPLAWDPESSAVVNIVTSGYVLADMLLIIPVILLVALVIGGSFSYPWILIGVAVFLDIIGDFYYNLNSATYSKGDLVDVVWYLGYLLFAIAFIHMKANAESLLKIADKKKA